MIINESTRLILPVNWSKAVTRRPYGNDLVRCRQCLCIRLLNLGRRVSKLSSLYPASKPSVCSVTSLTKNDVTSILNGSCAPASLGRWDQSALVSVSNGLTGCRRTFSHSLVWRWRIWWVFSTADFTDQKLMSFQRAIFTKPCQVDKRYQLILTRVINCDWLIMHKWRIFLDSHFLYDDSKQTMITHLTRPKKSSSWRTTRALIQYKDGLSRYGDSHVKDKTVARPSYFQHGDPYTGKTSLYWDGPQGPFQYNDIILPTYEFPL